MLRRWRSTCPGSASGSSAIRTAATPSRSASCAGRARNAEDFWAVRDLTLQIPKGSVYGLIGHNGSGKSTLLKMIGGIYRPTEGTIATEGRVGGPDRAGCRLPPRHDRTREHRAQRIDPRPAAQGDPDVTEEIIDFSGLGDFINDPVKHYSSGMYVRLGFSVAVHMKPDVLLVDEVLAVGDEEFQRKCFDHLYALRRAGKTIIVVSHGLGQLEGLCDEIAWLERGTMQQHGPAVETIAAYLRKVNADESARNPMVTAVRGDRDGGVRAATRRSQVTIGARSSTRRASPISHAETGTTFQHPAWASPRPRRSSARTSGSPCSTTPARS